MIEVPFDAHGPVSCHRSSNLDPHKELFDIIQMLEGWLSMLGDLVSNRPMILPLPCGLGADLVSNWKSIRSITVEDDIPLILVLRTQSGHFDL